MDENEINEQIALDDLFELPETVSSDTRVRRIYSVTIMRMLNEVTHLSVPTSAYMLIERIAYYYAIMRERERQGLVFAGSPADKAIHNAFISCIQEFNKVVVAADLDKHKQLLKTVTQIIMYTLNKNIKDDTLRNNLSLEIALALEEAGVG